MQWCPLQTVVYVHLNSCPRIVKTLIWSTVLHAAETWTLRRWTFNDCNRYVYLDWTPIQLTGFGHGEWNQKLDEHHSTKTEKLVSSCVEKWIPCAYSLRRQNGRDKNSWEAECDTMIDWMKSNDVEYKHIKKRTYRMTKKTCNIWRPGPAWKGRYSTERERERERQKEQLWCELCI